MALDPVPWFIGGGAEHSPDVARLLAHAATGGAAGVIAPTDLLCTTTPAPTGNVRVMPGAAIIPNTYAGVTSQSYMARAVSVTDLPVTATGSAGGRSDMVVVRVDDPQFGGAAPVSVEDGPYVRLEVISNVGAGATAVPAWVTYPAIPLARIDLPANTATVTASLIKDLRALPNPRRTRDLYNTQIGTASQITGTTSYTNWGPQANRTIAVPAWATQVKVICHIIGAQAQTSATYGTVRANFGGTITQVNGFDMDPGTRTSLIVADTLAVTPAQRGTGVLLKLEGQKSSGSGQMELDGWSTVLWDIEFLETPSAD